MQSPSTTILSWSNAILIGVSAAIGAIVRHIITLKKLPSDIHKTEADARLVDAQTDDLIFRRQLTATEMFSEMAADVGELQFEKVQLKKELEKAEERIRVLEIEQQKFKAERLLHRLKE